MTEQLVRDSLTELKFRIGELQVFCGNFLHQFGVALSAGVGIGDPEHPVHDVDGYRRNPVTPCCYKVLERLFQFSGRSHLQKWMTKKSGFSTPLLQDGSGHRFASDEVI